MNSRILDILEFYEIQNRLLKYAVTASGSEEIKNLVPFSHLKRVHVALEETKESMDILRLRGGFPLLKLESVIPHMKRLKMGANLNALELAKVSKLLRSTSKVNRFIEDLESEKLDFPRLFEWNRKLTALSEINQKLRLSVSEEGLIMDEASSELKRIRGDIRRSEEKIRTVLTRFLRGSSAKYLSDSLITIRSERFVLPVKQEHRNAVAGVVHDQSATGQTLYIEPQPVVDLNNQLRRNQIEERQEIERILSELSALLVPFVQDILQNSYVLGHLDFLQAKSYLAKEQKAVIPEISEENQVNLRMARHPLLNQEKLVTNDLVIGKEYQTLVITGPNTGGKTVTLKTLGLLQIMAQSGLAIPVAERSAIGIFTEIFADIGDEQSIEQNLSTFSSHMTHIVDILKVTNEKSLVLFDELGAGTDPQEGAALAVAILDAVSVKGSCVLATTHYPELKAYGYHRSKTMNASMEFDVKTLSPTYRLLIGIPGRSNAFEISKRLGLSFEIIEATRSLMDEDSQKLDKLLLDLENQRKISVDKHKKLSSELQESERLIADLREEYQRFSSQKEAEFKNAQKKAAEIVDRAQKESELILQDIRELQKRAEHSLVKEHELIDAKTKFKNLKQEEMLSRNRILQKAKKEKSFKVGDEVIVSAYSQRGVLAKKVSDKDWVVQVGIIKMTVNLDGLVPAPKDKEKKKAKTKKATVLRRSKGTLHSEFGSHAVNQLDLRGKRYDEALILVDRYLDQAILSGFSQVTIIHGRGTGVLREGVTSMLRSDSRVKDFEFAPGNAGGDGATIVRLW
ncbi:MAG: endonuclease MutS2 [Lactobacillales bacterium]|jgi:DNA mismatch repair protein MutS2|nr:endonuclease MutS2 [Lactobacillales bacterium]